MGTVNRFQTVLTLLESRLQAFFEGGAGLLFSSGECARLPQRLAAAMQAEIQIQPDGSLLAPNRFTLIVHPTQECALPEKADLLDGLAGILQRSGEDAGWRFLTPPVVRVIPDDRLSPQEIQIVTAFSQGDAGDTRLIPHVYTPNGASARRPDISSNGLEISPGTLKSNGTVKPTAKLKPDVNGSAGGLASVPEAFLIVEGSRTVPLTRMGLTIGRRPDMSLVLNNPHVSRVHAQIRLVQGRYVIFDLDSSGGTFVNGQRVAQSILHAGDVISLAGVQLIYGQEASNSLGVTQKIVLDPSR